MNLFPIIITISLDIVSCFIVDLLLWPSLGILRDFSHRPVCRNRRPPPGSARETPTMPVCSVVFHKTDL